MKLFLYYQKVGIILQEKTDYSGRKCRSFSPENNPLKKLRTRKRGGLIVCKVEALDNHFKRNAIV